MLMKVEVDVMPLISIIVPVYKVEQYLVKCIDSILDQSLSDFELILINDGSPDNCGHICDTYAQKDKRIKVVHKENGGLSDARNVGIDLAQGKYIGFVDSDDYIEKDMYEVLLKNLEDNDADISICGYYDCYQNKKVKSNLDEFRIMNTEEAIEYLKYMLPVAWNKLYKKEVFENVRYPVGKLNEDTFIIMDLLIASNKIVLTGEPKYNYVRRGSSITKNSFNSKHLDVIEAWEKCLNLTKLVYPRQLKVIEAKYFGAYFQIIDRIILCDNYMVMDEYKRVELFIKKNILKIISSKHIHIQRKLASLIFIINSKFYKSLLLNKRNDLILFD